ncbi:MAG: VanZ family protein [Nanoarchaeota archaeon]|mgnify:CR=1 FL=1
MLFLEKRRFFVFFMLLLIGVEIFYISSIPGSASGGGFPFIPITYHFSVFFLFSFFLFFLIKGKRKIKTRHAIFALFLSLAYAVSDEFHQSFVPMRSPSLEDIFVDLIGISFSILISIFISRKSMQEY